MIQFGTDGIRGEAGTAPITPEVGVLVGRAAVRLAGGPGKRVGVVRDTRPSGRMLQHAVASGVAGAGGVAVLGGVAPTSALAAALGAGVVDAGVMLTASHNAAPDNGFKVFAPGGRKLTDAESREVESWLAEPAKAQTPGTIVRARDEILGTYISAMEEVLPSLEGLRGQRIALDLAHGAATPLVDWLRTLIPAEIILLGAGDGVINEGVGSEHPELLAAAVRAHGCTAGLAVDGDADRALVVDETGAVVPGDALTWLLAKGMMLNKLAVTVMSNAALESLLPGVQITRTSVGDRYLAEAMREHNLPLGAEESGHVLFQDGLPAGDGLLTGLRVLAFAAALGGLREATAGFKPFPRYKGKLRVARRPPLDTLPELQAQVRALEPQLGDGGRVFLRYSGTEPVLRVLVEGHTAQAVEQVAQAVNAAALEALS